MLSYKTTYSNLYEKMGGSDSTKECNWGYYKVTENTDAQGAIGMGLLLKELGDLSASIISYPETILVFITNRIYSAVNSVIERVFGPKDYFSLIPNALDPADEFKSIINNSAGMLIGNFDADVSANVFYGEDSTEIINPFQATRKIAKKLRDIQVEAEKEQSKQTSQSPSASSDKMKELKVSMANYISTDAFQFYFIQVLGPFMDFFKNIANVIWDILFGTRIPEFSISGSKVNGEDIPNFDFKTTDKAKNKTYGDLLEELLDQYTSELNKTSPTPVLKPDSKYYIIKVNGIEKDYWDEIKDEDCRLFLRVPSPKIIVEKRKVVTSQTKATPTSLVMTFNELAELKKKLMETGTEAEKLTKYTGQNGYVWRIADNNKKISLRGLLVPVSILQKVLSPDHEFQEKMKYKNNYDTIYLIGNIMDDEKANLELQADIQEINKLNPTKIQSPFHVRDDRLHPVIQVLPQHFSNITLLKYYEGISINMGWLRGNKVFYYLKDDERRASALSGVYTKKDFIDSVESVVNNPSTFMLENLLFFGSASAHPEISLKTGSGVEFLISDEPTPSTLIGEHTAWQVTQATVQYPLEYAAYKLS